MSQINHYFDYNYYYNEVLICQIKKFNGALQLFIYIDLFTFKTCWIQLEKNQPDDQVFFILEMFNSFIQTYYF